MFAVGDYKQAASVLNNLLGVTPGMDWTTLISLYSSVDVYATQLRALEAYCKTNSNDASAHFVLAYQYLVAGHSEEAVKELKLVTLNNLVIRWRGECWMLYRHPPKRPQRPRSPASRLPVASAVTGPTTDLVGSWRAELDGDVFDLMIDENNQFNWKATPKGKRPITIGGDVAATGNVLVLKAKIKGAW